MTANLKESEEDFDDELVNQFQNSIRDIKKSRKGDLKVGRKQF